MPDQRRKLSCNGGKVKLKSFMFPNMFYRGKKIDIMLTNYIQ